MEEYSEKEAENETGECERVESERVLKKKCERVENYTEECEGVEIQTGECERVEN